MRLADTAFLSLCLFLSGGTALAHTRCRVADPTSTPLNVRTAPNGIIIGTLKNGDLITIRHSAADLRGRYWAYVTRFGESAPLGWVFRDYLICFNVEPVAASRAAYSEPNPAASPGAQTGVAMQEQGGIYVVPVVINNAITLDFTVDSGASDVSIPKDVVLTLLRTGTITKSDFIGEQTYVLADGSKVPSMRFRLRSLKVGDHLLKNVVASIAPVQGSLLLGQSFLRRFQYWSVDNRRHRLLLNSCCQPTEAENTASQPKQVLDAPSAQTQLSNLTRQFMLTLYRRMSLPNDQAIGTVNSIYADTVNYFGTDMPREEVVTREIKFLSRWPIRIYKPKDGQVFVKCDAASLICSARGVLDFDARSVARNQRSAGEATFEYRLRFSSPFENTPKVILENGTVLKRTVQVLSRMGNDAGQAR